jgi:hypothetical protein
MSSGGSNPWWIAVQVHASKAKTAHQSAQDHVLLAGPDEDDGSMFELGTPVVIEDGPLEGVRAISLGLDARQLLIVAVTLRRQTVAVQLDPNWVRIECPDRPVPAPAAH